MTRESSEALMSAIMDIGKTMLVSGAEIYRVEDTIKRLVYAYGGSFGEVVAVPSHIITTACFDNREYTLLRRIERTDTDLELLDRVNDLSRRICRDKPAPETLAGLLADAKNTKNYLPWQQSAIYALTSFGFALFFGGSFLDASLSALIAGSLYWVRCLIIKNGGNRVLVALFCSAYGALMTKLMLLSGFHGDADKIIIGVVMVLIPGVEMVNGFRDFSVGDIQAGLMHLAEALFLGVIIAVGAAGMFLLLQEIGI